MPKYVVFVFLFLSGGNIENTIDNAKLVKKFLRQHDVISKEEYFWSYNFGHAELAKSEFDAAVKSARYQYKLMVDIPDYPIYAPNLTNADWEFFYKYDKWLDGQEEWARISSNAELAEWVKETRKEKAILSKVYSAANAIYTKSSNTPRGYGFGLKLANKLNAQYIIEHIGLENYLNQNYPPPVPVWRFKDISQ